MNKVTVISPANIAFIKFWGKKDSKFNIPYNNSLSMNLSHCLTTTSVEFMPKLKADKVFIDGKEVTDAKKERVVYILDVLRKMAGKNIFALVKSKNNFPSDAGIASSASAFSALSLAASSALELKLSKKELSIIARLGSGSASRSIVDGFAEWRKGKDSNSSYAVQLAPAGYWDLRDIVAITSKNKKKTSSGEGHALAETSPYFKLRLKNLPRRISKIKKAFFKRDFKSFGEILEEEAIDLHVMAMTSKPPIIYWNQGTLTVMNEVLRIRQGGIFAYFTMDAGPNVHVICLSKDEAKIKRVLSKVPEVLNLITNRAARGARIVK